MSASPCYAVQSMRLPHAQRASIPRAKLVDYLLSEEHPAGAAKARFFARHGYRRRSRRGLRRALLEIAQGEEVAEEVATLTE